MKKEVMQAILQKIKEYDRIIITRHFRPDGDAIGSTKGLQAILKLTYPEKEIYLLNEDSSEYLAFLGGESEPIEDEKYADALCIVLDTGNVERISNKKYALCKELIKIDHHIDHTPYGDLSWVEEHRSSACEMVAAFYAEFAQELKIDKEAATYIYAGMVTDSGRFRYDSTNAQTFRMASFLMEQSFDVNEIYRNLYADSFESRKLKAMFTLKIQFTPRNVAYIYTTKEEVQELNMEVFSISRGMVGTMADMKGVDIWVNFTETDTGVLCELRSSKFNINPIAVKYGGGGHAKASGANLKNKEEAMAMLQDLDAMMEGKL